MQNLKSIPGDRLLEQIKIDARSEREAGLKVIYPLREIARRRLDAKLGYPSLHAYCMEELKYSSGSAFRRIQAMQALQDLPELAQEIADGKLTLTNVFQVQEFCSQKDIEEKREILHQVSGLSKREAHRVLATIAPLPERPEQIKPISADKTELRVTLDSETLAQLDKVRDLLAHAHPGMSYSEAIAYLAQLGIQKLDPAAPKRAYVRKSPLLRQTAPGEAHAPKKAMPPDQNFPPAEPQISAPSIPASTLRELWRKEGGRCSYRDSQSGRTCGATRRLQPDHILPRARGGSNEFRNLRLRCQRHNLLEAIGAFGAQKMGTYLR